MIMGNHTRRNFLATAGIGTLGALVSTDASEAAETFRPRPGTRVPSTGTGSKNQGTYTLTRQIPIYGEYDVVVAGGGPAGIGAAICAARLGAKVLLIEATGWLGGMGTSGLVNTFGPMTSGTENLAGGLIREIVETLYERKFLGPTVKPDSWLEKYRWIPFQIEGYKLLLDELTTKAGVHVQFFTTVIDADADAMRRQVNGLITQNVEGYHYVKAKTFIDCSGTATFANLCGAKCREPGRDTDRIMSSTLCAILANVNWNKFKKSEEHELLYKAIDDGHFTINKKDRHLPGIMGRVDQTIAALNASHMYNLNALRCRDLTDGIMLGRRIVQEYLSFYRKYVPGCENVELVTTANLIGVRETRRIVGEYELNIDDYMARRKFPDQIGIFAKFVDIHAYDDSDEEWERFIKESGVQQPAGYEATLRYSPGEYYGIPYGILVPKGWKNLWVAGRIISADIKAQGSVRAQPACCMMGQAAGTAAVQSIKTGQPGYELNTETLVQTLREAKANLPQEKLSKTMTRS